MRRHLLAIALTLLSVIESSLVLRTEWWPGNAAKNLELLLFAYFPALVWLCLEFVSISNEFRVVVQVFWLLAMLLGSLAVRLLLHNQLVGLAWYGVQFWWGVLGIGLLVIAGIIKATRRGRSLVP